MTELCRSLASLCVLAIIGIGPAWASPAINLGPIPLPILVNGEHLNLMISARLSLSNSATEADLTGDATVTIDRTALSMVLQKVVQGQLPHAFRLSDCVATVTQLDSDTISSAVGELDVTISGHTDIAPCSKLFIPYHGEVVLTFGLLPAPISAVNQSLRFGLVRPATITLPLLFGKGPQIAIDNAQVDPILQKLALTLPSPSGVKSAFQGAAFSSDGTNISLFLRADAHATGPALRQLLLELLDSAGVPLSFNVLIPKS